MIRAKDWLLQAERDLAHAKTSRREGDYEWSCFAAQQAGEKSVKALLNSLGFEVRGHSITELLEEASKHISTSEALLDDARRLDKHYIPTRYPNSYASGAPFQYYTAKDAQEALEAAGRLIEFASQVVNR